jgi:hypothetical protein
MLPRLRPMYEGSWRGFNSEELAAEFVCNLQVAYCLILASELPKP